MIFLRIGRHFRIGKTKVVVGRNENENKILLSLATKREDSSLEVKDYMGPITVIIGKYDSLILEKAAALTARYSDAPRNETVEVTVTNGKIKTIKISSLDDKEIETLRI
jgi:predicted ribosome quality control (RQC) complex YloA/Tae2 family protein